MIPRIDLRRDYSAHKEEFLQAIQSVCEETAFSGGKYADLFEEEFAAYCGVRYASGVNNGTSAIHCALSALGIGVGDEVIVPANTYIATAWGVTYTGATPVFVDCTSDTWELDWTKIEERISSKTKAIIGVHLYGQPFEYNEIRKVADKYSLYLVEDCAQAHGAEYEGRKVGGLGELGCFSFYPGKNLYCFGEGGMVTCNDFNYVQHINIMKNQGCKIRYYHEMIGYNMRMEGIQGAVLSVGLRYLPEWTNRRREIGRRYLDQISNSGITFQTHPANTKSVFHLFVIEVEKREDFVEYMKQQGICCDMHYPVPCHLQEAYTSLGYREGDCPNAEYLAKHCVSLPMFPEMRDEEVEMVIKACNSYQ